MKLEPRRTCLGCRRVRPKRSLVRLVRDANGTVKADPRGREDGRGAYVCAEPACVERGLTAARLSHALREPCVVDARLSAEVLAASDAGVASGRRSSMEAAIVRRARVRVAGACRR